MLPNLGPNNLQFLLWYTFSLEPHESLNEEILIINDSDAADEDKEEELVIYFFSPSFTLLLNNESHSVQAWKTHLSSMIFMKLLFRDYRFHVLFLR